MPRLFTGHQPLRYMCLSGILMLSWLLIYSSSCIPALQCSDVIQCPAFRQVCVAGQCVFPSQEAKETQQEPTNTPDAAPSDGTSDNLPPDPEEICESGATRACFTAPIGCDFDGSAYNCKGECKAGTETCIDRRWSGQCDNQQVPAPERDDDKDHNCNGEPRDGLTCRPSELYFTFRYPHKLYRLAFHPHDTQLAIGTENGIQLLDLDRLLDKPVASRSYSNGGVPALALTYIQLNTTQEILLAHNVDPGNKLQLVSTKTDPPTFQTALPEATGHLTRLVASNNGASLFASDDKGSIWLFNATKPAEKQEIIKDLGDAMTKKIEIIDLVYAAFKDGAQLAIGYNLFDENNGFLRQTIETRSGGTMWQPTWSFSFPAKLLQDITFIPQQFALATASQSADTWRWEAMPDIKKPPTRGDLVSLASSTTEASYAITANPNGTWLAMGTNKGSIKYIQWQPKATFLETLDWGSKATIQQLVWSPQGNFLAAISDNTLNVWRCQP